jgi:homoserine dehydrogenase
MKQVNAALLGFGNVARSLARHLETNADTHAIKLHIRAVADASGGIIFDDPEIIRRVIDHKEAGGTIKEFAPNDAVIGASEFVGSLASEGIQMLIESLPTNLADGQPALDLLAAALRQGVSVVTVDKGPLVCGFDALRRAAREGGSQLGYSGTTGVAVPDEIAGERVLEIRGVLNGTTNYILTEMQERAVSFRDALTRAQADGIAEPDPTLDVEGWDAAAKILILAKTLMGADATIDEVSRIGIGPETESLIEVARESNRAARLVARARIWQGRVRVSVAPKLVTEDSPLFAVRGTSKAALFRTEGKGEFLVAARSGRDAISQTILDDVGRILNSPLRS